MVHALKCF